MSGLAETIQYVSERAEATLAATLQPLRDDFAAWHTARGSDGDMNPPSLKPFTHLHGALRSAPACEACHAGGVHSVADCERH